MAMLAPSVPPPATGIDGGGASSDLASTPAALTPLTRRYAGGFGIGRRAGFALSAAAAWRRPLRAACPIFPGPIDHVGQRVERARELDLAGMERLRRAERERAQLIIRVLTIKIERETSSRKLAPTTVAPWRFIRTAGCAPEAFASERPSSGFDDQQIGVAELLDAGPRTAYLRRPQHRDEKPARLALPAMAKHHRRRMMMAHRHHIGTRLIDAAVNDPLGVKLHLWRPNRFRIERVFQNVSARSEAANASVTGDSAGVARMTRADMTESIEHAFIGEDTVGERQLLDHFGHF